jgi:flagellar basal body rod protein FlgG
MTIAMAAALEGIQKAELQVNRTAARLARPFAVDKSGSDAVDLSAEMVALMEARNNSAASVKLAQTADEIQGALLNLLG